MYSSTVVSVLIVLSQTVTSEQSALFPLSYQIDLNPDFDTLVLSGTVRITIQVQTEANSIQLNAKYLNITAVQVTALSSPSSIIPNPENVMDVDAETFTLNFPSNLQVGLYDISVTYTGKVNESPGGVYVASYAEGGENKREFILADLHGGKARQAFVCFDDPQFPAMFSLKIARPSADYITIASGSLVSSEEVMNKTWDTFTTSDMLPTGMLSFAIIDFAKDPTTNFAIYNFRNNHTATFVDFAEKVSQAFYTLYNLQADFIHIVVPDEALADEVLHGSGLTLYRSSAVLFEGISGTTAEKQAILETVALSFAQQNLIKFHSDQDSWVNSWFNEAVRKHYQMEILMNVEPMWRMHEQFLVRKIHPLLASETDGNPINLRDLENVDVGKNERYTTKAFALLRMLMNYEKPGDIAEIENELITFFWAETEGYPVVTVLRTYPNNIISLEQNAFPNKNETLLWPIPINYASPGNSNFRDTSFPYLLRDQREEGKISASLGSWVILNKQQIGYYRVHYTKNAWDSIIELSTTIYTLTVDPATRAQIIDDVFELVRVHFTDFTSYLDLLEYITSENDLIPLMAFFKTAQKMRALLNASPQVVDKFKTHICQLIDRIYKSVGLDVNRYETHLTRLRRREVLLGACALGHADCQLEMLTQLQTFVSLHPDMREAVFCGGLRLGNISHFMFVYEQYKSTRQIYIVKSLACTPQEELLQQLVLALIDQSAFMLTVLNHHKMGVFYEIIESDLGVNLMIQEMKQHTPVFLNHFSLEEVTIILEELSKRVSTVEQQTQISDLINCFSDDLKIELAKAIDNSNMLMERNLKWGDAYLQSMDKWLDIRLGITTSTSPNITTTTISPANNTQETTTKGNSAMGPIQSEFGYLFIAVIVIFKQFVINYNL